MEKLLTQKLTNGEFLSENADIAPVNWESVSAPFSTTEVVNVNSQDWVISETQLDSRTEHQTYRTATGQVVHWKAADGMFEPFYESVAYELGSSAGVSFPFTSPAFFTGSGGVIVLGVVSLVLFTTTLAALPEEAREVFFLRCNKTTFVGESVLAVWWRNFDWSNKFDSVAVGFMGENTNKLYYYVFDHSHIYRDPSGERNIENLQSYSISGNFWQRKYLKFNFFDCVPFIEKIEKIPEEFIREVFTKWAEKIGNIDKPNMDKYLSKASEFSEFLIQSKNTLRRELELFFQGVSFAS